MKVMERLAGMSDEEYEKEMALYQHPLLIDGTRYLFKENPFFYAKERSEDYYPEKVEQKAMDLYYLSGVSRKNLSYEDCHDQAKGLISIDVLRNPEFKKDLLSNLEWIKDVKQFQEPEKEKEGELDR